MKPTSPPSRIINERMEKAPISRPRRVWASSAEPRRQRAFTLTELLAVTATVALLAAAGLPSAGPPSQGGAQGMACLNNKRQLSAAWLMYASDNSSRLATTYEWVAGDLSFSPGNTDNTALSYLVHGQLGPYLKGVGAYKCPEDRSMVRQGEATLPRVRSSSMDQSICLEANSGWVGPPYRTYKKLTDITVPAPVFLWVFIDENPDSINDASFAICPQYNHAGAAFVDGPSLLHQGGCTLAFADGHAELHQWQDPRTLGPMFQTHYQDDYAGPGYVMPNNLDVAWLEFRTSANTNGTPAW